MLTETKTTLRHFKWDDLEQSVEVINAAQAAIGNDFRYTLDELRREMDEPDYDAERDGFVFTTDAGLIVGFGDVVMLENSGRVDGRGYIHPDFQRRGLGTEYVRATDAHVLEITKHFPAETPVFVQRNELDTNLGFAPLMEREGYELTRRFYRMMIDDLPASLPSLPENFTLRPFDTERDARAVYDTVVDAFRDHWGFVPMAYEMWRHYSVEKEAFDPSLWLIAYAGNEIAGICLCSVSGKSMPDLGYVNTLGVRREWRRLGLGEALLRHAFTMFRERGFKRVGLGVDASSKTNAVALYERAGMHVFQRHNVYRKVLRGDASTIAD